MDRSDTWGPQSGTFDDMMREQRLYVSKKLKLDAGENTDSGEGAASEDIVEAFSLLLTFASAVEYLLQRSSKRSWRGIAELSVPIKSLIDQLLTGEDSAGAQSRLMAYCKTAIAIFGETHIGVERKLDEMSLHLAEELRPEKIMKQAKVSGLSKVLGLQEIAFWREFCKQVRRLDPDAVRHL